MKAYLYLDSTGTVPGYDLLVGDGETDRGMCEEVEISPEQFADWKFVLGHHKEDHEEFKRVQREMGVALRLAIGREVQRPAAFEDPSKANPPDAADWWKSQ